MALIGKIRSKSGLLVGVIGLALLSFILSDYKSMFGFSEGAYGIGTVFGEKVDPNKYSLLIHQIRFQLLLIIQFKELGYLLQLTQQCLIQQPIISHQLQILVHFQIL